MQGNLNTQNAQSNVKKVDNTYNYEELLTRLGIIGNASDKTVNEEIQKEDTSENKPEKDDHERKTKKKTKQTPKKMKTTNNPNNKNQKTMKH